MRKIFSILSVAVVLFFMFMTASCDKATNYTEGNYDGIFTVWGQTIRPEMQDTFYVVGDLSSFGLKTGDRAEMRVNYYIDNAFGPSYAKWSVDKVYSVIVPEKITSGDDIQEGDFESCILQTYNYGGYGDAWAWNGLQNINVAYECDGTAPQFRLIAPEVSNNTLTLTLVANIKGGDKRYVKLLTYDLASAYSLLDRETRYSIERYDSIYTKIKYQEYDYVEEAAVTREIDGGKLLNPFKAMQN